MFEFSTEKSRRVLVAYIIRIRDERSRMSTKLYVGGIPYSSTDNDLSTAFAQAGNVVSATVITDRMSGRSKGFGFVEMSSEEEAQKAIELFNGQDFQGRKLTVNVARPMQPRAPRQERNW